MVMVSKVSGLLPLHNNSTELNKKKTAGPAYRQSFFILPQAGNKGTDRFRPLRIHQPDRFGSDNGDIGLAGKKVDIIPGADTEPDCQRQACGPAAAPDIGIEILVKVSLFAGHAPPGHAVDKACAVPRQELHAFLGRCGSKYLDRRQVKAFH